MRATSSGVASVPAITMAGSPGINRSIANTSTVITRSVTRSCSTRDAM